jgi:hypothetical protein
MTERLYIFALNADVDVRHTHLTRAKGEVADLPPLTEWLGAEVDEAEIELFPVRDLGDMTLSEYVRLAFAPEAVASQDTRRMDGLKGTVLLVPEHALSEEPAPGPEAKLIASVLLAQPRHDGDLPKADVNPMPRPAPEPQPSKATKGNRRGQVIKFAAFIVIFILLFILLDG